MEEPVVHSNPRIQGGVPVFAATRVPVKNLFDYLEAGDTLDQFLIDFPAVDRAKAIAALEMAREALDLHANPAR
jgi:uncharacterized protein (DUF433 family)